MTVISLDFDDTLVESETIKRRILVEIVSEYENGLQLLEGIKTDAREAGVKVTRYTIFRDFAFALGHNEEWGRVRADDYSKRIETALACADEIPGATTLLRRLRAVEMPCYINSATPQGALEKAVHARGWAELVTGILGAPETGGDKADNLRLIAQMSGSSVLHVGDGNNDESAAARSGASFIGVRRDHGVSVQDMFGTISYLEDKGILPKCRICEKNASRSMSFGGPIWASEHFILCHASPPCPIAGWLVLHTLRHLPSPAEFNDAQANALGSTIRKIQQSLLAATNAHRIYCCAMAETSPHFHMHLIPRLPDLDPTFAGFNLFSLQAKAKLDPDRFAVPESECNRIASILRNHLQDF